MVFSSDFFDPPPNWHQQPNPQQQQQQSVIFSQEQILPSPPTHPQPEGSNANGLGSIRPGSMLDRARMARVPLPEPGLKCPRCDSSNTKFCYFNNYNLTQPRHFCKACRRYWTRGGALRNVPVGGRLRKNKRSKGRAKSTPVQNNQRNSSNVTTNISSSVTTNGNGFSSQMVQLPYLHHLNGYSGGFGLNLGGGEPGSSFRVHQLTNLLSGLGSTGNGFNPFHENVGTSEQFSSQSARVKPEENSILHGLNMSKNVSMMGINQGKDGDDEDDHQYSNWGSGNGWTDISGFNSMGTSGYGDRARD